MRRTATLAFVIFALAASLPAEIRECLPMATACARFVAARQCALAGEARSSCALAAREARTPCSPARRVPLPDDCRLHPTPDGTATRDPLPLPAPVLVRTAEASEPALELPLPERGLARWIDPPAVRPRAAPRAAPFAPRPPPLAV